MHQWVVLKTILKFTLNFVLSKFYSFSNWLMHQWVVLKNNIKIYIKFCIIKVLFILQLIDAPVSCLKKQY